MKFLTIIFIFFNICFCSFSQTQLFPHLHLDLRPIDTTDSLYISKQAKVLEEVESVYDTIQSRTQGEYFSLGNSLVASWHLFLCSDYNKSENKAIASYYYLDKSLRSGEHISEKQIQKALAKFDNDTDKYIFNRCIECLRMIEEYDKKPREDYDN